FTGWGGSCSGSADASCTVVVTAQSGLAVSFSIGVPVTIESRGAGAGLIGATPDYGPPPCASPGPCTLLLPYATGVTLTPVASSGVFGEWTGACDGTPRNASCQLHAYAD